VYAPEAVLDAVVAGERVHAEGGAAIVERLRAWWPGPVEVVRWQEERFADGLLFDVESRDGASVAARHRQFLVLADGLVSTHRVYSAPVQGAWAELPDLEPLSLGEVVSREPLTHPGQTGNLIERVVLDGGRAVVVKHLLGDEWLARATGDDGREARFWEDGVFARVPPELDHAVVGGYRGAGGAAIAMRDATDELLAPGSRISRDQGRRILDALAALHRAFAGETVEHAATLEARLAIMSPATLERAADAGLYIPAISIVGWEVFADAQPADVVAAVLSLCDAPAALSAALRETGVTTLLHGDPRGANLGFTRGGRVVAVDWGIAAAGPPAIDLAHHLFLNGRRLDATFEDVLDDFRAAAGELSDERALRLALLAQLVVGGGLLAHELVESDPGKREVARAELDWWCARAREGLELL